MDKKTFFHKNSSYFFFDDMKRISDYCKSNWPENVAHILRVANEVVNQEFIFDLKWDMERTYEPVIFEDSINWSHMPGDDPEFIYQFNRHRYWICLGQAYAMTMDEKYAEAFVKQFMSWVEQNPLNEKTKHTTWRTIEAGLRGEYWCKAIQYFRDSKAVTDEVIECFYKTLVQHAEYIIASHSPYRLMSNWGVLEDHGLFVIGMTLPPTEHKEAYIQIALKHLETQIRMQVMNDGVHWEQSPMYHNEVLHCYLDVLILAQRNQIPISETMQEYIRKMAHTNIAWKKPNHHQFMQGDSDDTDIRDLISKGAYLFKDPVLKGAGFSILDFESIWDLGIEAAKQYSNMQTEMPSFKSIALHDSGNYYIRSDWSEDANLLHFHCGTLGAGHGHSDKLHFDLVVNGEDVLMDAGRYNYVANANRYEFKDPSAHNTIMVDGEKFTICKDSWECTKLSQPVKQQFVDTEQYAFVQGGHLGYMDMPSAVFVNRKIVHIKPDLYIIVDEMYTGGTHSYSNYFHFNNHGIVSVEDNKVTYTGEKAYVNMHFCSADTTLKMIETRISRNYNQAEPNKTVVAERRAEGFCSMITVISANAIDNVEEVQIEKVPVESVLKGIVYPEHYAEGVRIQKAGQDYVVIVCHQEVNSPTDLVGACECMGFGNVIVFNRNQEREVGTVLNW